MMDILAAVLSGYLVAILAPVVPRLAGRGAGWILALLPASIVGYFSTFLPQVADGAIIKRHLPWAPTLGLDLAFRVDGLSLLFVFLIAGIGTLIFVYAGGYLGKHPLLGRVYSFLLLFMASMLGLVLADNLLALFVFWELTSISSYLLIGFDHERPAARQAALQALLITGGGGLALLAGLLLLGQIGGTMDISLLNQGGAAIQAHSLYVPCLLLILLGAFTKSAQFPFHFWLPNAMEAPTPISAYLHSATMVKAGIYLLARLSPALGGTATWLWVVTLTGATTMVFTAVIALAQSDLKRILAYSTLTALGILTFLLGLGGEYATKAAMVFVLAHAMYKGALFLVAGTIDHETGTRDIDRLAGLFRAMPITAVAGVLGGLSMAGIVPMFGFIGKELLLEAALHEERAWFWAAVAAFVGAFLVAVGGLVGIRPFVGSARQTPKAPHEAPVELWLGSVTLATLGFALGLMPGWTDRMIGAASAAVLAEPMEVHLALWHGLNLPLLLSGISLVGGILLYTFRDAQRQWGQSITGITALGPAYWYELALAGLNRLSATQTRFLQSGYLRYYLIIVLLSTAALAGFTLIRHRELNFVTDLRNLQFYDAGLVLLVLPAILAAVRSRTPLAAIAALGVVGYGIALIFVLFGAPDVAMTQFLVETLTVILFVLIFHHVPISSLRANPVSNGRNLLVAASVGCLMTVLVLIAAELQHSPPISEYFIEHSYAEAHGKNIVNVILVDFRALDTLGEITVLGVAGIGVFALLRLRWMPGKTGETEDGVEEVPERLADQRGGK